MPKQPTDKELVIAAIDLYENVNIFIDDTIGDTNRMVSMVEKDPCGAYVQAWVWVNFNEVKGYEDVDYEESEAKQGMPPERENQ